jgi:hypothetical protein
MPSQKLSELSYAEGIRGLEVQERTVDQLRARTGLLLAASSLSASFLGSETIQRQHTGLSLPSVLALIALVVSIGLCVYLLVGKKGFVFSLNPAEMYEALFEYREDENEMQRRLAYWTHGFWEANDDKLKVLWRWFTGAAAALILQLVFWSWSLAASIK